MVRTDKFTKIILLLIAGLLAINILQAGAHRISIPFLENKVSASTPAFIQVGKTYNCSVGNRPSQNYEIMEIDKENGWIKAKWSFTENGVSGMAWLNISHFQSCVIN